MTALTFEAVGAHDRRLARSATGVLGALNRAGVLTAADVHVARTLARLGHEQDDDVVLATALATRAVREGAVCVDLARVVEPAPGIEPAPGVEWPEPTQWLEQVRASRLAAHGVLVIDLGLVYLQRYHHQELAVVEDLLARAKQPAPIVQAQVLAEGLQRIFPGAGYAEQRAAAETAARTWTTVLTGGPGTGKTTTVAGVLALLAEQQAAIRSGRDELPGQGTGARPLRVALAAPTGKAAARLQEAVSDALETILAGDLSPEQRGVLEPLQEVQASTLHRLLGRRPGSASRFGHDRDNRLPHDLVIVDESSMMSLTMTTRLLEAVRPQARLVLVGDPDQLVSIDAGAVLADLVAGSDTDDAEGSTTGATVARLRTVHRFGRRIGTLAQALRDGDADAVLEVLRHPDEQVRFVEAPDPAAYLRSGLTRQALALREASLAGDEDASLAALEGHRLLCAHREGPYGVRTWNRRIEQWVTEATGDPLWDPMYPGRPLLVTANDYALGLYNGDTGVVVRDGTGHPRAVIAGTDRRRRLAVSRLGDVDTMHAMTIHKAQGSQARQVTVLLPAEDSALLTRELLYTAVTRAREQVVVVGSEEVVRAAVQRQVRRASGLRQRLGGPDLR